MRSTPSLALDLYQLVMEHGADDPRVAPLRAGLEALVREDPDVLTDRAEYAIRMSNPSGVMEGSEWLLLIGVCDEVHALAALGVATKPGLLDEFDRAMRIKLATQKSDAGWATDRLRAPWKREMWWYDRAQRRGGVNRR